MRRRILEASTRLLLVLVVATYCSAQTAKPGDGGASGSDDNGYGSPIGDGTRREQAYLSSSAHKSPSHQPSGYISGTIFDESGAVSTGADVSLSREVQTSDRKVKSGSNGEFLFSNVAPGSFSLRVTAPGFATREFSATLDPGKAYLVPPIFLAVASAVTKVDVNASPLTPVQVADMQIEEQEKQRIFGLIPNFYATYDRGALPLNSKQKFRLAWKTNSRIPSPLSQSLRWPESSRRRMLSTDMGKVRKATSSGWAQHTLTLSLARLLAVPYCRPC